MARSPIELLQRTRVLVPEKADWFRTFIDWYSNYKVARQVVEELSRLDGDCWLSLSVNGQPFVKGFHVSDPQVHELSWVIPPDLLHRRDNEITVTVEKDSTAELLLASAAVAETSKAPRHALDLSVKNPRPLPEIWLPAFSAARHRPQCRGWSIIRGGSMTFGFAAADSAPVHFILSAGTAYDATVSLDDLLDEIMKAVERQEKEIRKKLESLSRSDPQTRNLEIDLEDLRDYKKLHREKIEPAFRGRAKQTKSDGGRSKPRTHEVRPARATVVQPQAGFLAGIGKLFIVLVILAVGGGLCYSAWRSGELDLPFLDDLIGKSRQRRTPEQERINRDIAERLQATGAKTGVLQISLGWFNRNDLDLHVVTPLGETINYAHRQGRCGGRLDVDMNVNFVQATDRAIENIFWTNPPRGHYQIFVNHFTRHNVPGCEDPTQFGVRVVNRGQTQVFTGAVVNSDAARRRVLVHEFDVN